MFAKKQSAIREARDQLFLDTADGTRLNIVTANLGLDRPLTGVTDDEWRALAKEIALQPKLITDAFRRVIEVCMGPQKTLIGQLAVDAEIGDTTVTLVDTDRPVGILQVGTLVFDPGQPSEESVGFCFRDHETKKVFLTAPLLSQHDAVAQASDHLTSDTAAGAGSLVLTSTALFPETGFPYSVILDRGLETEEVVVVTANSVATSTLTLLNPTTQNHRGPKSTFVRTELAEDSQAGRTFIKLPSDATRDFPFAGFVRLAFGTGSVETQEYESNDAENDVLYLRNPLTNTHSAGVVVELVNPGSLAETVSVLQQGVGWGIHDTEPRKVKITLPAATNALRLQDASWIHGEVPAAFATTLAAATASTDTVLELTSVSGLPDEAGLVLIDGSITRFYILRSEDATPNPTITLTEEIGAVVLAGASVSLIRNVYSATDLEDGNIRGASGALVDDQFPGPYLYDSTQLAPSLIKTTLAAAIPYPTRFAANSVAGQTCVEVESALTWPAPPFTPFSVRLGGGTGFSEDRTLTDRTLQTDASTTVDAAPVPNPGATSIAGVDTTAFPQSNGVNPARYRIIVDRGGANEEVLEVLQNSAAMPGTFTLASPTTVSHSAGETIELLNDVLTFDALTEPHKGPAINPSAEGHKIEQVTTSLSLVSGTNFPISGGTVYLNFGNERIDVRKRIAAIVSPTILEFDDTSVFPPSGLNWLLKVGEGLPQEEYAIVTGNDTGLNRLILSSALVGTFAVGDYVEFKAGVPATVDYTERTSNTLEMDDTVLGGHSQGESVILSPGTSTPSETGFDYPLLMPPSSGSCVAELLDLVRAAGVEVEFIIEEDNA